MGSTACSLGSTVQPRLIFSRFPPHLSPPPQASIVGALSVADLVKTSLGPKGMDKILQSTSQGGNVSVTNDGATILKSVLIDVCPPPFPFPRWP